MMIKIDFLSYIVNILVDNKDRSLPGSSLEKLIQTVARHSYPFSASPYNLKMQAVVQEVQLPDFVSPFKGFCTLAFRVTHLQISRE